uniref:Uncharacterized protein n=1 Tax=Megaselia scalaris TaxID=36166 RepID=T1GVZ5_MEGSC
MTFRVHLQEDISTPPRASVNAWRLNREVELTSGVLVDAYKENALFQKSEEVKSPLVEQGY